MDIFTEFAASFSPSQSGFQFMWILAAVAVAALFIMVERFICLNRYTDINPERFFERLLGLLKEGRRGDAFALCGSAGKRVLPMVLGAGVHRSEELPDMVLPSMEEEMLHVVPLMELRLDWIATLGNLSTLLGLMGTIYGLILAFAAVAQPGVSPVEKSSMLAVGISAAMNTTLLGLIIAVPCVLVYSMFRARVDETVAEIDRYGVALIKVLAPDGVMSRSYHISDRRIREEVDTEPNMVPFMNLMVVLIPLLLSQSEFIKVGMIELKLPESSAQSDGKGEPQDGQRNNARVDLGIVITAEGFNLFHCFSRDSTRSQGVEIPLVDGKYDFVSLNKKVAEVKRKALYEIVRVAKPDLSPETELWKLSYLLNHNDFGSVTIFEDHESVKIVADDRINYQTVVSVMDAARGTVTASGTVTLFPNVSIAGGIVN